RRRCHSQTTLSKPDGATVAGTVPVEGTGAPVAAFDPAPLPSRRADRRRSGPAGEPKRAAAPPLARLTGVMARAEERLAPYRRKRDFARTPEPQGQPRRQGQGRREDQGRRKDQG